MKKLLFYILLCIILPSCSNNNDAEKEILNSVTSPTTDSSIENTQEQNIAMNDTANVDPNKEISKDNKDQYLSSTKNIVGHKDGRKTKNTESETEILHHAEVDSALVIDHFENKNFIKKQIDAVAKEVVMKKRKKTIAEQMGAIGNKKISISIDENVSIKDAIMEVARLSGVDVEVDPDVDGSVILSLTNTPVSEVLERIAEMTNLVITVKKNVVRFNANKAFVKNYNISLIDNTMQNSANGRQSIANNNNRTNGMSGINGVNGANNINNNNVINQNTSNNTLPSINQGNGQNFSMWEQFENGLKYIISQKSSTEYSINKQAGVVTLRAPISVHNEVEEYIEKIKKVATTQILVEVRLVEVTLEDEFSAGIDFNYSSNKFNSSGTFVPALSSSLTNSPFLATFNPLKKTAESGLKAAVNFLQTFGTTKTISSPRLNVMNNQRADLSFAKDYVYFALQPQLQNQFAATGVNITSPTNPIIVQSVMQTVPVGVILDLQATADIETNEITMNVHPILSAVTGTVNDPAASFLSSINSVSNGANITNAIPVIEKKELNSTLRIKSGDIMVIGGFNEERSSLGRKGIPVLKDMPLLKYIFGSEQKYVQNVETVIFIKATIIDAQNPILKQDVDFYNDFA